MSFLKRHTFHVLILILLVLSGTQAAQAASPVGYGRAYNLFVHSQNAHEQVPMNKAQQVLDSYFLGAPLKASFNNSSESISQREFLTLFEKLRLDYEEVDYTTLTDKDVYYQSWLRARRQNWLPNAEMTYSSMEDFIYRFEVSRAHGGIAYYEGLVLDPSEITPEQYGSIAMVRQIKEALLNHKTQLSLLKKPTRKTSNLLTTLESNYKQFVELEEELVALEHPLQKLPELPEDIRQKIVDHDLNQVLDSLTYDYSSNASYRRHNLTVGASKMQGMVYMPGEEMDFTQELIKDGWGGVYKYGWVIYGPEERWAFGGGLCGSATIVFTPSWRAGLEIVERSPHSTYFSNLYPEESLGLDATIYRNHKNLVMKNSTDSPILYYVYDDPENEEITLYIVGNSPYKNIDIEGPIQISPTHYKWIRRMERFDGKIVEDELETRYSRVI